MAVTEPIAIVGMAARLPGSRDVDEFWTNIAAGRECLTELTDEELIFGGESPELIARADYVRRRPVLPDSDQFDAQLFGMTPREAQLRDPQYRILLESVHAVLEHAGYDPGRYPGAIGLFAGTNVNRYRYDYIEKRPDVLANVGYLAVDVNNHPDYMSTYIAYKLGLRGPAATLLTACSSSLVAVHVASTAIRAGDCEMAVAGGVDIEFPYHRGYAHIKGGISSQDGMLRVFDADASGTNFGDGVATVLLKRLADAERDGDTVYAVILGSAINNDGDRKVGYTAPSVEGQSECIRRALAVAGRHPRDIDYLEAHGTGTRVGDPIELAGLIDAYRTASAEPLPHQYCALSSVKSNIGHLGQAAGVAALIKTVLALRHRKLPPGINITTPTPEVDWAGSPFYLNTELRDWPETPDRPRCAGVSSFGIGGTNAHAVLAEAPEPPAQPRQARHQILVWSAMDRTAEQALRDRLGTFFQQLPAERFGDAAHTLRVGRTPRPVRCAVLATDPSDAAAALADPTRLMYGDGVARPLAFAFPGQAAQYPGMFHDLYRDQPLFQQGCDAAFDVLEPLLGRDLRALWLAAGDAGALGETEVAQPLLYVLEYTLAHCLTQWGVAPGTLLGHSLGELVAAAVAGVFDFESGLRAVAARAQLMQGMPRGAMLAVRADPDVVADLCDGAVVVATVNGADQIVLAGPTEGIERVAAVLSERGVASRPLTTSHAYHSPAMRDAADQFRAVLAGLDLQPPTVRVISAATGQPVEPDQARDPAFWADQLTTPVQFDRAAATLLAQGAPTVLEVGPGRTLIGLLGRRPDTRSASTRLLATSADRPGQAGLDGSLARLWLDGTPVDFAALDEAHGYRRTALPGYPYQRRRFWVEPAPPPAPEDPPTPTPPAAAPPAAAPSTAPAAAPSTSPSAAPQTAPAPARQPGSKRWRLGELAWLRDTARVADKPVEPRGHAVLLAPGDHAVARTAQAALQRAGYRTVRIGTAAPDPTGPERWLDPLDEATGPVLLVHAASLDAAPSVAPHLAEATLTSGLDTLRETLVAAASFQRRRRLPTRVVLLGRHLVDVSGAEPVNPAAAALLGLLRSAARELPAVGCQVIDVADGTEPHLISDAVNRPEADTVALRGASRWVPRMQPVLPGVERPLLRDSGTYLITGGLGGIGLVTARVLADSGRQPRLTLVGRTGPDALPEPARAALLGRLVELTDAGADVEIRTADVADADALRAVVEHTERVFGPVNGVFHAAGVPGGGLLERRDPADIRRVLRPKVAGLLAIEEVFASRPPLDFLLLYSSQAALTGLYGSADYAAANAYLDAHAARGTGNRRRTISIQWPGWAEVGMLARSPAGRTLLAPSAGPDATGPGPQAGNGHAERCAIELVRTPSVDWEFDEHVFDGLPVLPGTALLELAVVAARADRKPDEGWPVQLRDVVFLAPVIGDRPRRVRVLLTAVAGVQRFRVQSRPADSDVDPWTDNATGLITGSPGGAEATPGPVPATAGQVATPAGPEPDLTAVHDRVPDQIGHVMAAWMTFGPRWETTTEVFGNDQERLARLVLPDRYHADLAEHPVHPAIMDVAAGVLTRLVPGRNYAPFTYRRLTVFRPFTPTVSVHARFTAGERASNGQGSGPVDFDLYDSDTGALLARAESFVMREVPTGGFQPGRAATVPSPATPTGPPPGAEHLLTPADGAAALDLVLREDVPPVVTVDLVASPVLPDLPAGTGSADPRSGMAGPAATPERVAPVEPAPAAPPAAEVAPARTATPPADDARAVAGHAGTAAVPAVADNAGRGPDGDEVLAALREFWQDELGMTEIGLDDDFFEIGGNSLGAVQLSARINRHFGTEISAGSLFDTSTLRTLADDIRAQLARTPVQA